MAEPQSRLDGRAAIVTGAGRGIGQAIARRFAAEGARVALLDLDGPAAAQAAQAIAKGGGTAFGLGADVASAEQSAAAVDEAAARLGGLDVVVNAAAALTPAATVETLPLADWAQAMAVNVGGVFHIARAALPHLRRSGRASIVNVASQLGSVAVPNSAAYCASKGAVLQLTRALALDHAGDGVRVNSLSPGAVMTDRLREKFGSEAAARAALTDRHPLGRLGEADEIAGAAVFLASDDAAFMTGADLVVDGGYIAQ